MFESKDHIFLSYSEDLAMATITQEWSTIHTAVLDTVRRALYPSLPKAAIVWERRTMPNTADSDANPDIQVIYDRESYDNPPVLALATGFAHSSQCLQRRVNQLMLIDIKESPTFVNPLVADRDDNDPRKTTTIRAENNLEIFRSQRLLSPDEEDVYYYQDENDWSSPIFIHGLQWVGRMTGVVQVFARDPVTGGAVERTAKMQFYGIPESLDQQRKERRWIRERRLKQGGKKGDEDEGETRPVFMACPDLDIKPADFMPTAEERYQRELILDWDFLRFSLRVARTFLAEYRCGAAEARLKKDGLI